MAFNQLSVTNPGAASYADGSTVTAFAGKQAETLVSEVHGKWYTAAYRGKVFFSSTAVGGTTIPLSTTTAATFVLYNPIGSGVNVELISYDLGITQLTSTVDALLLGFSAVLPLAPTGLTALSSFPGVIGASAAANARVYSVATITATTSFYVLGNLYAANAAFAMHHDFDGKIVLGPGTLAHTCCGTTIQTPASQQSIVWAEWPV